MEVNTSNPTTKGVGTVREEEEGKADVSTWKIDQVVSWAKTVGLDDEDCANLRTQKVNGKALLLMIKNNTLSNVLPAGPAAILADNLHREEIPDAKIKKLEDKVAMLSELLKAANNVVDVWDQHSNSSGSSNSRKGKLAPFRKRVVAYYRLDQEKCMLTGVTGSGRMLKASHIWPARQAESVRLQEFCLTAKDVNSPRNGLLLLDSIESAFDRKQICFTYDPFKQTLNLYILDPSLGVTDYYPGKKFAELHGNSLLLPKNVFPFRRLLSTHARAAFIHARQMNWISQEIFEVHKDYAHLSDVATQGDTEGGTGDEEDVEA